LALARRQTRACKREPVKQPTKRGFAVQKKRWIVERTFAWFESYRRLSKDFEFATDTSETMIRLAMTRLMLNRIT